MDARLDTLSTELYRVSVRVSCIAWRQAIIGGFAPEASNFKDEDEDDDNGDDDDASDDDDDDDDGDVSSTNEMST